MDSLRKFECLICLRQVTFEQARKCARCASGTDIFCAICRRVDCNDNPCMNLEHKSCFSTHVNHTLINVHSMVNPSTNIMVDWITWAETKNSKQNERHRIDRKARWFSIKQQGQSIPSHQPDLELIVHDRFKELCNPHPEMYRVPGAPTDYPSFVSFIGRTSVGKSSLIRAMILMGIATRRNFITYDGKVPESSVVRLFQVLQDKEVDWPVGRSNITENLKDPTTFGVHLYRDEGNKPGLDRCRSGLGDVGRKDERFPLLFADCEGFGAGRAITNAERHASTEAKPTTESSESDETGIDSTIHEASTSSTRRMAIRGIYRYPVTASSYNDGKKDGIELFYARFLYAVSDVVVFVMNVDAEIREQLIDVLEWAACSVYKSVNYSTGKSLIIVRHLSNMHRPEYLKQDVLKRQFLNHDGPPLWDDSPVLAEFRDRFNKTANLLQKIDDNKSLYNALFQEIDCWYIPDKIQVAAELDILVEQWVGLRTKIDMGLQLARAARKKNHELYTVPNYAQILKAAFEHFSSSDKPFDFYEASGRSNPNPQSMDGHLANFICHVTEYWNAHEDEENINSIAPAMISDIVVTALLTWTWRKFEGFPINPAMALQRELDDTCSKAIDDYIDRYERCCYKFNGNPDDRCVTRPEESHNGHTSASGSWAPGPFERKQRWRGGHKSTWIASLEKVYDERYTYRMLDPDMTEALPGPELAKKIQARLREERIRTNSSYSAIWGSLRSNKTCFSCLQAIPDHVLPCGHSYCPRCIQELGQPFHLRECTWYLQECHLCGQATTRNNVRSFFEFKPPCAGIRVLSLDGGGVRGIVELTVLKYLEDAIGLGLRISDFFDLIVGTSTGGIVSLGLAMTQHPIEKLMAQFALFAENTFRSPRATRFDPGKILTAIGIFLKFNSSLYSAQPLEDAFSKHFGSKSLFGPAMTDGEYPVTTRVAVTSATNFGQTPCIISNYNYPNLVNAGRQEDLDLDMTVSQAARATSAAPWYLPPFIKNKVDYWDGAVSANCPARTAYLETQKLWPGDSAPIDMLLSIGTGTQNGEKPPRTNRNSTPGAWGFLATAKNMLERQVDSKEGWNEFRNVSSPTTIRDRLHRLDPPLGTDKKIELDDYKKIDDMIEAVEQHLGPGGPGRGDLLSIANRLIANVFFFERKEVKENVEYKIVDGYIKCRFEHGNLAVRKLLQKVTGFFYTASFQNIQDGGNAVGVVWSRIEEGQPVTVMTHGVEVVRIPHTMREPIGGGRQHLIAVEFKGFEGKIPISGFPCTLPDLIHRSSQKWLQ